MIELSTALALAAPHVARFIAAIPTFTAEQWQSVSAAYAAGDRFKPKPLRSSVVKVEFSDPEGKPVRITYPGVPEFTGLLTPRGLEQ